MENLGTKKLLIIAGVILTLIVGITFVMELYNNYKWKARIELQNNFIKTWGTYDYKDFNELPQRVKELISDDFYNKYFSNKEALAIREGKLASKRYQVYTEPIKTLKKSENKEFVIITTLVKENVRSLDESYEKEKTIVVMWDYSKKERPNVIKVEYK